MTNNELERRARDAYERTRLVDTDKTWDDLTPAQQEKMLRFANFLLADPLRQIEQMETVGAHVFGLVDGSARALHPFFASAVLRRQNTPPIVVDAEVLSED